MSWAKSIFPDGSAFAGSENIMERTMNAHGTSGNRSNTTVHEAVTGCSSILQYSHRLCRQGDDCLEVVGGSRTAASMARRQSANSFVIWAAFEVGLIFETSTSRYSRLCRAGSKSGFGRFSCAPTE